MPVTLQLTLVARYDKKQSCYIAYVKHVHGDNTYNDMIGYGASPDEARGHLLREMVLAGMNDDPVFLDIGIDAD